MNYYYTTISGSKELDNMEILSKWIPDNITELGFLCSACRTYCWFEPKPLCNCCNEDSYYMEEIKEHTNNLNKYHSVLIDAFRDMLFSEYNMVYNISKLNHIIDLNSLSDAIYDNEYKEYLEEVVTESSDIYDIARVYAEFVKDKTIKEEDFKFFDYDFIKNYNYFRSSYNDLKELSEVFSEKMNTYNIVFGIPKEKDNFNIKSRTNIFMFKDKEITVKTKKVESLTGNMMETLVEVTQDKNGVYIQIDELSEVDEIN
ncbi:MAG: hypothetical protein IJ086_04515 [Clostridium sp.]|nr:hypothetical protein [Clostridium sp.]